MMCTLRKQILEGKIVNTMYRDDAWSVLLIKNSQFEVSEKCNGLSVFSV